MIDHRDEKYGIHKFKISDVEFIEAYSFGHLVVGLKNGELHLFRCTVAAVFEREYIKIS